MKRERTQVSDEELFEKMVEEDIVTPLRPVRRTRVKLKIRSIRRAKLRIVEPEGL